MIVIYYHVTAGREFVVERIQSDDGGLVQIAIHSEQREPSDLRSRQRILKPAFQEDNLIVDLSDGRSITVPLAWYPRLVHGTPDERHNWRWIGDREGIHWPDLDEDISVENLILGQPSGESQDSFRRWLEKRAG